MDGPQNMKLAAICQRHGVSLAYLFGSRAQAGSDVLAGKTLVNDDPLADLDLGVVFGRPPLEPGQRLKKYAALYNELEDLVRPFRLDLVFLEETHSVFQSEAIRGSCVYQESETARDDYELNILRRAADFKPFLERYYQELLEEV